MNNEEVKQLRSFGFIAGGGFAIIALWPTVFRNGHPRLVMLMLAGLLLLLAILLPRSLRPAYRVWMALGHVLGWVNTRIILSVMFYILFMPVGLVMRLLGKDPMLRKFERNIDTYRVIRQPRPSSHMKHQF
jgi:saxitoxin biosynthesis operon SxtJ-like protein